MKWAYDSIINRDGGIFHHVGPYYGESKMYFNVLDDMNFTFKDSAKVDLINIDSVDDLNEPYCYAISFRYAFGFDPYNDDDDVLSRMRENLSWLKNHRAVKDANEGKAVIVLYDYWEGEHFGDSSFKRGDILCDLFNINPESVIFINDNLVIQRYAEKTRSHVYPSHFFESTARSFLSDEAFNFARTHKHPLVKPKRFLSYSRHWNEYRQFLILELFHRRLLEHGLVSCSTSGLASRDDDRHILRTTGDSWYASQQESEEIASSVDAFVDALPFTLDCALDRNLVDTFRLDHFLATDISLINETWIRTGTVFLSEKTWKAIYVKHPFILMGNPGSLDYIKKLGYQTFSPIIDESYDSEESLSKRKNMVLKELENFCKLEERERVKKLEAMHEITEHNYRVISSRKPFEIFKGTIEKIANENYSRRIIK